MSTGVILCWRTFSDGGRCSPKYHVRKRNVENRQKTTTSHAAWQLENDRARRTDDAVSLNRHWLPPAGISQPSSSSSCGACYCYIAMCGRRQSRRLWRRAVREGYAFVRARTRVYRTTSPAERDGAGRPMTTRGGSGHHPHRRHNITVAVRTANRMLTSRPCVRPFGEKRNFENLITDHTLKGLYR